MQTNQIEIGRTYAAKITDAVVPVRIDEEHPSGGWRGTNLHTNKKVRIKSARKLRNEIIVPGADEHGQAQGEPGPAALAERFPMTKQAKKKPNPNKPPWAARQDAQRAKEDRLGAEAETEAAAATQETPTDAATGGNGQTQEGEEAVSKTAKKKSAKKKAAAKKGGQQEKAKGYSILDAAEEVLKKAHNPLTTKEMIERMAEHGLWSSTAATPHATLYSAILREMQRHGNEARFRKAERGKFELNR